MNVTRFPVNPFVECTYLLWICEGGDAVLVDPGMMRDDERKMIDDFITMHYLNVKYVLLTHIHIDHVTSAKWASEKYGAIIAGCEHEERYGAFLPQQAEHFRLKIDIEPLKLDKYLKDKDVISIGDEEIKVLYTPGHSSGSLSFYVPMSSIVLTGDALFAGSIGRTDLPGGDFDTLISSIRMKLFTLPSDTMVYPGHGPATTIGDEMRYNPYL